MRPNNLLVPRSFSVFLIIYFELNSLSLKANYSFRKIEISVCLKSTYLFTIILEQNLFFRMFLNRLKNLLKIFTNIVNVAKSSTATSFTTKSLQTFTKRCKRYKTLRTLYTFQKHYESVWKHFKRVLKYVGGHFESFKYQNIYKKH